MDQLAKMKKKYDGKSVAACVKTAKKFNEKLIENGRELVLLLWYLEKTKRFKEYKGYEKQSFETFLNEVCLVPYNRYRQIAYAYNWFPKEAKKYGPQTIQTIRQKVDSVTKIPKVLKEIDTTVKKLEEKNNVNNKAPSPLKTRQVINEVIEKYAKPKTVNKNDTKAYWRAQAKEWEKIASERWDKIQALTKEVNQLREQLARNRKPLENYSKIRGFFENTKNVGSHAVA